MGTELEQAGEAVKSTIVVDAHAFLWFLEDSGKLSEAAASRFADPDGRFVLPAIVIAESIWAIAKNRVQVTLEQFQKGLSDARFEVRSLDLEIVLAAAPYLDRLEMHDALIVATTEREILVDPLTVLLTADETLHSFGAVATSW
jgi:PIN domain nuclease of toxin-antitoxin system